MIESKHRHDFVTCSCGASSVDGGKVYLRRAFMEQKGEIPFVDMSVTETEAM